jgi:hypothetical protein
MTALQTCQFTWAGVDEIDKVHGSGLAKTPEHGSLDIEFTYHLGNEALLKAEQATSSAAC